MLVCRKFFVEVHENKKPCKGSEPLQGWPTLFAKYNTNLSILQHRNRQRIGIDPRKNTEAVGNGCWRCADVLRGRAT
jgi:hypothetical protein